MYITDKKNKTGASSLRNITLQDVKDLKAEELVVVNRIRINSMLTEVALLEVKITNEQLNILKKASNQIKNREKQRRCVIWGARITAKDVLTLFGKNDHIPSNSFAIIK